MTEEEIVIGELGDFLGSVIISQNSFQRSHFQFSRSVVYQSNSSGEVGMFSSQGCTTQGLQGQGSRGRSEFTQDIRVSQTVPRRKKVRERPKSCVTSSNLNFNPSILSQMFRQFDNYDDREESNQVYVYDDSGSKSVEAFHEQKRDTLQQRSRKENIPKKRKHVKSTRIVRGRRIPKLKKNSRKKKKIDSYSTRYDLFKHEKNRKKSKIKPIEKKKEKLRSYKNVKKIGIARKPQPRPKPIVQNSILLEPSEEGLCRDDIIDYSVVPKHNVSFQREPYVSNHLQEQASRIDSHALYVVRRFREDLNLNLSELIFHLFDSPLINEPLDKFRVIFRFIAEILVYKLSNYHPHDPIKLLRNGCGQCCDYARCFKEICEAGKLRCKIIGGYSKGTNYSIGDDIGRKMKKSNHDWNMIFVRGKWYLCDLTWSSGNSSKHEYTDRYWCVPPSIFITDHFPEKSEHQLLSTPKSFQWFGKSCIKMQDVELMESLSHTTPLIRVRSTSDVLTLSVKFREGVKVMEPGLKECRLEGNIIYETKMKNCTWIEYDKERKFHVISVMFPQKGEYILTLFAKSPTAGKNERYGCCTEYKIEVLERVKQPFLGFPLHYSYGDGWYQLIQPFQGNLKGNREYDIVVRSDPGQWKVLRIGDDEIYYDQNQRAFVGKFKTSKYNSNVTVYAYKNQYGSGSGIFQFQIL